MWSRPIHASCQDASGPASGHRDVSAATWLDRLGLLLLPPGATAASHARDDRESGENFVAPTPHRQPSSLRHAGAFPEGRPLLGQGAFSCWCASDHPVSAELQDVRCRRAPWSECLADRLATWRRARAGWWTSGFSPLPCLRANPAADDASLPRAPAQSIFLLPCYGAQCATAD